MMESVWPSLLFGGFLILLGSGLAVQQKRLHGRIANADPATSFPEERQHRRRLQIAILLILVGVLIPLGDLLPFFRRSPMAFVVFWGGILLLVGWICLLALADFADARAQLGRVQRQLHQQKRELEVELNRIRSASAAASTEERDSLRKDVFPR